MSPEYDGADTRRAAPGDAVERRVRIVADLLDDAVRIPGTQLRFGLDPLLGLIPGIGDLVGGALSAYIIVEAARAGAPPALLLRMLGNVGVDSLIGALPVAGDAFDFAWKSNSRNVRLLRGHLETPRETRRASVALVALVLLVLGVIVAGGLVLTVILVKRLFG